MIPPELLDTITTGDARELAERIPDESVDLVFTDPPYSPEYLPLYEETARIAARVLKPGGLCLAYAGLGWFNEVMAAMGRHLTYFWILSIYEPSSNMVFNAKNVGNKWRPVVAFSKGPTRAKTFITDLRPDRRDKRYHEWGQGEGWPLWYVPRLTQPGDIVLDPFCGGGTVPAVCKQLTRHYVAFEIDPETAERARERVANTQVPLFVVEPQQLEMPVEAEAP